MKFALEDSLKMMWKSLNKKKPKPQNESEPPESAPSSSSCRSKQCRRDFLPTWQINIAMATV